MKWIDWIAARWLLHQYFKEFDEEPWAEKTPADCAVEAFLWRRMGEEDIASVFDSETNSEKES